jgi:hypothetical protein
MSTKSKALSDLEGDLRFRGTALRDTDQMCELFPGGLDEALEWMIPRGVSAERSKAGIWIITAEWPRRDDLGERFYTVVMSKTTYQKFISAYYGRAAKRFRARKAVAWKGKGR